MFGDIEPTGDCMVSLSLTLKDASPNGARGVLIAKFDQFFKWTIVRSDQTMI